MRVIRLMGLVLATCPLSLRAAELPLAPEPAMIVFEGPRERVDLGGLWRFTTDPEQQGLARSYPTSSTADWDLLGVPGCWNEQLSQLEEYSGIVWYTRDFYAPPDWASRQVHVVFQGVMLKATVWINGQNVGSHEGGFTPFKLPLGTALRCGEHNRIAVQVDNTVTMDTFPQGEGMSLHIDWYHWGGIFQPVYLEAVPQLHVSDVTVKTVGVAPPCITAVVEVANTAEQERTGKLSISIVNRDGKELATHAFGTVRCGPGQRATVAHEMNLPDATLWHVDRPYCHTLAARLSMDNEQDGVDVRFGIRTIATDSGRILLNGSPVFFCGAGRVQDFPVLGRTPNDCIVRRDYDLLKRLNCNSYRPGGYTPAVVDVQLADEQGTAIFMEFGTFGKRHTANLADPEIVGKALGWLTEAYGQFKNSPSFLFWDLGTEILTNHANGRVYYKALYQRARQLDPSRPILQVHELARFQGDPETAEMEDVIWCWCGNFNRAAMDYVVERAQGKPIIIEFGVSSDLSRPESLSAQTDYFLESLELMRSYPNCCGAQWWALADYRAGGGVTFPVLGVVGNGYGVFNRARQPKPIAAVMSRQYALARATQPPAPTALPVGQPSKD